MTHEQLIEEIFDGMINGGEEVSTGRNILDEGTNYLPEPEWQL